MRAVLLALAMGWAGASPAVAQCAEGRVASEASAGRCCWPAQRWNASAARCEGPPRCPSGRVAEGDTCVAPAGQVGASSPVDYGSGYGLAPPARRGGPQGYGAPSYGAPSYGAPSGAPSYGAPSYGAPGYGAPVSYVDPETARRGRMVSEPLVGLMVTGVVHLLVAYTYSVVVASIALGSGSYGAGQSGWAMYIPIVGGFIWPALRPSCGSYYGCYYDSAPALALGIPGAGVQVLGLILAIAGGAARRGRLVPGYASAPRLQAGPGELGAALAWDF
ncbi:MAG: hypothetical protein IT378_25305 [Sandaracinaceae bacterium]|nr:hypothetical protein [Sandaracinaceae bacterium]